LGGAGTSPVGRSPAASSATPAWSA
jgi:hypothetical protein